MANTIYQGPPNAHITLWTDEGLPCVRRGRGRMLACGSSLTESGDPKSDAAYIRLVLGTTEKVLIAGKLY